MKIKRILNPVAQENTYILENESASLVIDPGSNTSSILAKLEAIAKPVAAILLTHTHYDHIMSVEAVRQAYNHPPVYVAEAEKDWLMNPVHNLSGLPRHDALFKEAVGRWDLPTGNHDQLLSSIQDQLFTLPNHYRVFPGHGWDTTIGHEKIFNPHFS